MAPYGRLVTLLDPGKDLDLSQARIKNLQIAFTLMLAPMLLGLAGPRAHHTEILRNCAALIDDDRLRLHVGGELPLEQAAVAHERIAEGHTHGKLVLTT
jgi:NADPH2:quinone reductase